LLIGLFQNCGKMSAIDVDAELNRNAGGASVAVIRQTFPSVSDVSPVESFSIAGTSLVCLGECSVTFSAGFQKSKIQTEISADSCVGDCGGIEMTDFGGFSKITCRGDVTLLQGGIRCSNDLTLEM
jgi:hypothetical protein